MRHWHKSPWIQRGLALSLLFLSGCVYLRLYDLKGQLSSFNENFSIETVEGRPALIFNDPVMKPDDIVWLTGFTPTDVESKDERDIQRFEFNLIRSEAAKPGPYDQLVFTQEFINNRLVAMTFPSHYGEFLTPDIFAEMFEPIADADIRKDQKQTEWTWREMYIEIPDYGRLVHFLGPPSMERVEGEHLKMTYAYALKGHSDEAGDTPAWTMVYHVRNSGLRMTDVKTSVGRLRVFIDVSGEEKTVNMERQ